MPFFVRQIDMFVKINFMNHFKYFEYNADYI